MTSSRAPKGADAPGDDVSLRADPASVPPMDVSSVPAAAITAEPPLGAGAEVFPRRAGPALHVRAVFDEHYDFVWRALRRLGVAEPDVDDAVQEVFMVVHRKLAEFEGRSKLTTWLWGICYRTAGQYFRQQRAPHDDVEAAPDVVDLAATPEERYEGREARAKLDEVLATLDPEKRAVFVLYEIDEVPVDEIARRVGVPVGTVYSRLKVARQEFERAIHRLRVRWRVP